MDTQPSNNTLIIVAIVCLAALEFAAILTHEDGQFLLPVASIISGLVGYKVGKVNTITTLQTNGTTSGGTEAN